MNRIAKPNFLSKTDLLNLPKAGKVAENIPKIEAPVGDMMEEMAKKAKEQSEQMQKKVMQLQFSIQLQL